MWLPWHSGGVSCCPCWVQRSPGSQGWWRPVRWWGWPLLRRTGWRTPTEPAEPHTCPAQEFQKDLLYAWVLGQTECFFQFNIHLFGYDLYLERNCTENDCKPAWRRSHPRHSSAERAIWPQAGQRPHLLGGCRSEDRRLSSPPPLTPLGTNELWRFIFGFCILFSVRTGFVMTGSSQY